MLRSRDTELPRIAPGPENCGRPNTPFRDRIRKGFPVDNRLPMWYNIIIGTV